MTVTGSDDSGPGGLKYSITGGADQALFSIDETSGDLTFVTARDYENPTDANLDGVYDVRVTVTDGFTLSAFQNIAVTVTDVADNTAPQITSDNGGDTASVDVAENTTAVTDVRTDDDADSEVSGLSYSKTGGADAAKFSLDANTGVLAFISAPNFEAPGSAGSSNVYFVQVTVTDSGSLTDVQAITVTVTDVAETGTITIVKNTAPVVAGDGTFTFASSAGEIDGLSIATSGNTGTSAPETITAASITVTEDEQTGWALAAIACSGDDNPSYDVAGRTVTIDLDPDEDVTCTFTNARDEQYVVDRTQTVISNFLSRRADLITSGEPGLVERLLNGGAGGSGSPPGFTASGNSDAFSAAFSTSLSSMMARRNAQGGASGADQPGIATNVLAYGEGGLAESYADGQPNAPRPGFDVWASGHWAHTSDETRKSEFGLLNLGADYRVNPSLLVGVLAQFDWMDEKDDTNNTAADGFGWMAGPYLVARVTGNLIFDGRVAWGQSDNHVDPLGLYVDSFSTDRLLAKAQLTGDFTMDAWRFSPHVALIHFQEEQKAYTDSLGFTIPGQTVTLGRVTFGPEASYIFKTGDGTQIEPSFGVAGIWDYDKAEILDIGTGLAAGSSTDLRARVRGGLSVRMPGGVSLTGNAFYDGIGAKDLEIYGGELRLRVPIN